MTNRSLAGDIFVIGGTISVSILSAPFIAPFFLQSLFPFFMSISSFFLYGALTIMWSWATGEEDL